VLHASRFPRTRTGVSLLVAAGVLVVCCLAAPGEEPSSAQWIERGDAAFAERHVFEKILEAIDAYETVLPNLESEPIEGQAFVLNRLAQLHYELTTFTPGDTPEDEEVFRKGREYGLRSLRLNPAFAALEEDDFKEAVATVNDPAALLWTADNWGALLDYNPISGLLYFGRVRALYERCLAVEEDYWGASAHNALGAMFIVTPAALGGDEEVGRTHLEEALSLAPTYLLNHVVYAQYWGFTYDLFGNVTGVRDAAFIEEQLRIVLDAPIGEWPFWNREAKREAEALLTDLGERSE
jgi:phosphoglycolate phosphatase-like HAD superfamily hydrolase